ncbi:hypothetical protein C8Q78DRAFT_1080061 [Trametes maxima]|nr:hypothetical protein C8Q78DRAFT_1080061 [Trametes maxima]
MRSPVIAFSIIAAAVSPTLVSGAPASSPQFDNALAQTEAVAHHIRQFSGAAERRSSSTPVPVDTVAKVVSGLAAAGPAGPQSTATSKKIEQDDPVSRTQAMRQAKAEQGAPKTTLPSKRASDQYTAGGNSYSGAAADSSGGDLANESDRGAATNGDGSNQGGNAGSSFSGFSFGGSGNGHGPGGNAYSGATGASRGGNVVNTSEDSTGDGDAIENTTANTAGNGGFSESGSSEGGDARGPTVPSDIQRRASDSGTAGGNAYSGATSDVSGGTVANVADDEGTISNGGGNNAGNSGTTFSGDATGGKGNGLGPGGNAYTGASGSAKGGSVYNAGGAVNNDANSNVAGTGGVSQTGDATGGGA